MTKNKDNALQVSNQVNTEPAKSVKRGAPLLPAEKKRTARYPLRIWQKDFDLYERFCVQNGIKLAEFFRFAVRSYMDADAPVTADEPGGHDKVYIMHMTLAEKERADAFAASRNMTQASFYRSAAEYYLSRETQIK